MSNPITAENDMRNTDNWNDIIQEGSIGYIELNHTMAQYFNGPSVCLERIISRETASENAYCDGENPSGLSSFHLLSPYVLRYDIMAAIEGDIVSPSEIARSRNLRAVMFESGENTDNGEFYVGIAFVSEAFYQDLMEE